jgi:ribosomal-protein-alanine N-acetyltransferase
MNNMKTEWRGILIKTRYIRSGDLDDICRMLEKESVCWYLFFGPNTPEATRAYFSPVIAATEHDLSEGKMPASPVFTILAKDTGEFCGQCTLLPVDFCPGAYLAAYQIDDGFTGAGFGTEACEFLVYYAFTQTPAYRINGDAAHENTASWKIMEKCGFSAEGRRRKYWHAHGRFHDQVLYGLLKEDLDPLFLAGLKKKWEF